MALVAVALVAWLFLVWVKPLPFHSTGGAQFETAERYQYQPDPGCTLQEIFHLPSLLDRDARQRECANQAIDHRREVDDLTQQTRAAEAVEESNWFARANFDLSQAQFFLSILGAVALIYSLQLAYRTNQAAVTAAEAANEANRITRAESRPWLSLDQTVMCDFIYEAGNERCDIWWEYTISNKGKMPAHNVSVLWDVYRYDQSFVGAGQQGIEDIVRRAKGNRLHDLAVLFPSESKTHSVYGGALVGGEQQGTMFLCACVAYDLDPLGAEQALSAQAFVLENEDGRVGPLAFKVLRVNANGYTRIE